MTTDETGRPTASLAVAEQFALWAIRQWAAGHRGAEEAWSQLREGFALAGGADGLAPLVDLMAVVAGRARPLDVRCLRCPQVSPDEDALLAALAAALGERPDLAPFALRACLVPAAARIAVPHAERLATALAEAGFVLGGPVRDRPGVAARLPAMTVH